MGFRPGDHKPSEEERAKSEAERAEVLEAGTYVLAFTSGETFEIKNSNGARRFRGKARILDAEPKLKRLVGKHTFLGCSLNVAKPGAAKFLGSICAGMGLGNDDEFDPRSDFEVRRALLYRPIAVELKIDKYNGEYRNDWGRIHWRDSLKQTTLEQFEVFRENLIEEFGEVQPKHGGDEHGQDGDPGPTDADAPAGNFF